MGINAEQSPNAPVRNTRDGRTGKFCQLLIRAVKTSIIKKVASIILPKMKRSLGHHSLPPASRASS
ncbi:hypothetical protein SESBI_13832 [Sesbania bispinosa]|nr:hypothetical protein SESBI_13832 [Sesbania bispinosa]